MPVMKYDNALKDMLDNDPKLVVEMLEDALNSILNGDLDDGRLLLRQFVKATIGFQELSDRTGKIDKNLMRTLSKNGNPTAANLFEIIQACIDAQGLYVSANVERVSQSA